MLTDELAVWVVAWQPCFCVPSEWLGLVNRYLQACPLLQPLLLCLMLLKVAEVIVVIGVIGPEVFVGLPAALAGLLHLGLRLWAAGLGLARAMCIL